MTPAPHLTLAPIVQKYAPASSAPSAPNSANISLYDVPEATRSLTGKALISITKKTIAGIAINLPIYANLWQRIPESDSQ